MLELAGIALLPEWPAFLAFVIAGLALNIVPGADMTFIIAAAARGGRKAGVIAALGVGAGALFHVLAAVAGLSAILASSESLFDLIKFAGAAYLLWIAYTMIRGDPKEAETALPAAPPASAGWRLFRSAMMVNILNPKVALFFLAFLPQFVDPAAAIPALQILALGLWFDFAGTLVNIAIALAAAGAAERLRHIGWLGRAARWIAATAMGGLALQLGLSSRR